MNVDMVVKAHGSGPLHSSDLTTGYMGFHGHSAPITDASFSPDGSAVATASLDGWVKFFSTKMYEDCEPRWVGDGTGGQNQELLYTLYWLMYGELHGNIYQFEY